MGLKLIIIHMNPNQDKQFQAQVKTHSHKVLFFILGVVVVAGIVFFFTYYFNAPSNQGEEGPLASKSELTTEMTDDQKLKILEANARPDTLTDAQKTKLLESAVKANKNQPKLSRDEINALLTASASRK